MHRMSFVLGCALAALMAVAPATSAAQEKAAKSKPAPAVTTPVNLNTATAADLQALPGVGAATAKLIIEHREKNGGFKKIEELMNIKGIGEKSFLKLKPMVTVAPQKAERQDDAGRGCSRSVSGAGARCSRRAAGPACPVRCGSRVGARRHGARGAVRRSRCRHCRSARDGADEQRHRRDAHGGGRPLRRRADRLGADRCGAAARARSRCDSRPSAATTLYAPYRGRQRQRRAHGRDPSGHRSAARPVRAAGRQVSRRPVRADARRAGRRRAGRHRRGRRPHRRGADSDDERGWHGDVGDACIFGGGGGSTRCAYWVSRDARGCYSTRQETAHGSAVNRPSGRHALRPAGDRRHAGDPAARLRRVARRSERGRRAHPGAASAPARRAGPPPTRDRPTAAGHRGARAAMRGRLARFRPGRPVSRRLEVRSSVRRPCGKRATLDGYFVPFEEPSAAASEGHALPRPPAIATATADASTNNARIAPRSRACRPPPSWHSNWLRPPPEVRGGTMVMAEPAYASAGPIRVDRRAADRRRGAAALLAAVTSGLAVTRDTVFARERFEQVLRTLVQARSIALCERPGRRRRQTT